MYHIKVLIEHPVAHLDQTFDYVSEIKIPLYTRVSIPFARQTIIGFVVYCSDEAEHLEAIEHRSGYQLKKIHRLIDHEPLLNEELRQIAITLAKETFSPLIACFQVMLPSALKPSTGKKSQIKMIDVYHVISDQGLDLTAKQQACFDYVNQHPNLPLKEIPFSSSVIRILQEKGAILKSSLEVYRQAVHRIEPQSFHHLNEEQKRVYQDILNESDQEAIHLIHGVTGSGKTEIYMQLAQAIIKQGKTMIMLVPEIALTPMMIERFKAHFGDQVAILHSKLSSGERYDEYRRIKRGEASIVVGARSAIFAPLTNLGLIIIDEEHDASYKQDRLPRYHTLAVAKLRAQYHHCPLVLGSATPSLESYARAKKGVYRLHELKKRVNQKPLPEVTVVDMSEGFRQGEHGMFSKPLIKAIEARLMNKQQVILLLNRRGYASFVTCRSCGHTIHCPHCDVALTFHRADQALHCHYCGYQTPFRPTCPNCHSHAIKTMGIGTQQVEEQLLSTFLGVRVLRMDADTVRLKHGHQSIFDAFKAHDADILIGTQMIAKGIDFKNVTLVGVLNADMSLHYPDFRAAERTFQLLEQVAGRSGRHDLSGEVIIQTYSKDHYAIDYVKTHDYLGFYQKEMMYRKIGHYPPYFYIARLLFEAKDENKLIAEANQVYQFLKPHHQYFDLLGPAKPIISKIKDLYRIEFILKYREKDPVFQLIKSLNERYNKQEKGTIYLRIDLD